METNKTITEDYVHLETAKLLAEKGFNEDTMCVYIGRYLLIKGNSTIYNRTDMPIIHAPTLQMAMKYIRVKYGILCIIQPKMCYDGVVVYYWVFYQNDKIFSVNNYSETYEKCEEDFINYCLTNLIN